MNIIDGVSVWVRGVERGWSEVNREMVGKSASEIEKGVVFGSLTARLLAI